MPGIVPIGFPATDEIVALVDRCQKPGDFCGIVLQITVERKYDVTGGAGESFGQRNGLASIPRKVNYFNGGIRCRGLAAAIARTVRAAVVNENDAARVGRYCV